jgi:hypothetical protein
VSTAYEMAPVLDTSTATKGRVREQIGKRILLLACGDPLSATRPVRSANCTRRIHADGLADGDVFGLNKRGNLSLNLRGVGDATAVGVGVGDTLAVVFLRIGLGVAEAAAGDSAAEGDALLSTGGVASVLCCERCFGAERDSAGVPVSSCD